MGFISVLNTMINIIYPFRRQATQGIKVGDGEMFDPAVQKSQNSTLEISKALMESIKHEKYGQESDCYPFLFSCLLHNETGENPRTI